MLSASDVVSCFHDSGFGTRWAASSDKGWAGRVHAVRWLDDHRTKLARALVTANDVFGPDRTRAKTCRFLAAAGRAPALPPMCCSVTKIRIPHALIDLLGISKDTRQDVAGAVIGKARASTPSRAQHICCKGSGQDERAASGETCKRLDFAGSRTLRSERSGRGVRAVDKVVVRVRWT